ncbi:MAG: phosphoserine transaminase [Sphingomonadaceae bacterium]
MTIDKPDARPARPHFSSGPCAKPPGWSPEKLALGSLGRSHRSKVAKARLAHAIDLSREILELPDSHLIGIVPGSDTGAVEMAMWSMLGARPVTIAAWEAFGKVWVTDAVQQLRLDPTLLTADYGELPDLSRWDPRSDIVFTWNGTTSGVRVPDGEWIPDDRGGLTICDATSACFAMELPWDKLDVATFSWQKVMGSEAAHGMLILAPRAVERLETHVPDRPLPKLFRLTRPAPGKPGGKLNEGIFRGETINTPSLLATEDYIHSLEWAKGNGGLHAMIARCDANAAALDQWIEGSDWAVHAVPDPAIRTNTGICLGFAEEAVAGLDEAARRALVKEMAELLETEGVAFDIASYRDAPPGFRIWCGATVDADDIAALGPWLDWAFHEARVT